MTRALALAALLALPGPAAAGPDEVEAGIREAARRRGEEKADKLDALVARMTKEVRGEDVFNYDEWYDLLHEIQDLLRDRELPEGRAAAALHKFVGLGNLYDVAATSFVRVVEDTARERRTELLRNAAVDVLVNFMRFVRPKDSDDREKTTVWPAMTAIHSMHALYDEFPDDGRLRDVVRRTIMDQAVSETSRGIYSSAMSFLCGRFRSGAELVNEERERRDLDVRSCRG